MGGRVWPSLSVIMVLFSLDARDLSSTSRTLGGYPHYLCWSGALLDVGGPCQSGYMSSTEIDEATRLLSRVRTNQLDDESLLDTQDRLEKLGRIVDSLRVSTAAEVELRSDPAFGADGL